VRRGLAALLLPTVAAAARAADAPTVPAAGGALAPLALSLIVVLALVVAMGWLARRLRVVPRQGAGAIRVVADLPLGPRERVVLIEVGGRQALIGVSSAGVHSLDLLEQPLRLPEAAAAPAPLADRFRSLMERGGRA